MRERLLYFSITTTTSGSAGDHAATSNDGDATERLSRHSESFSAMILHPRVFCSKSIFSPKV
jgi:hypothetical protein